MSHTEVYTARYTHHILVHTEHISHIHTHTTYTLRGMSAAGGTMTETNRTTDQRHMYHIHRRGHTHSIHHIHTGTHSTHHIHTSQRHIHHRHTGTNSIHHIHTRNDICTTDPPTRHIHRIHTRDRHVHGPRALTARWNVQRSVWTNGHSQRR